MFVLFLTRIYYLNFFITHNGYRYIVGICVILLSILWKIMGGEYTTIITLSAILGRFSLILIFVVINQ